MDKSYLDYLLSEWANYHFHQQNGSVGWYKTSMTYKACKTLQDGGYIPSTGDFVDNTPDYIALIDRALESLCRDYRAVIAMEYLGTGKCNDKAQKLGITINSYRVKLCRARTQLMNLL